MRWSYSDASSTLFRSAFTSPTAGPASRSLYANRAWEAWLGPEKLPVAGKTLMELFPTAQPAGLLKIMAQVCAGGLPEHLKRFEFGELGPGDRKRQDEPSLWDWEIYPLTGPSGNVTHLLNVVMNVSKPQPRPGRRSSEDRQAHNRRREAASGVLRIFGVAPEQPEVKEQEELSPREHQVAEFMALGFTNATIGRRLSVSPATVSSHVAHILAKLGFRSRAQVAAWVVTHRLGGAGSITREADKPRS